MKVAIVGSRDITDYSIVKEAIQKSGFDITEIVSGGAKGVDSLAEDYANENNLKCTIFKPDWKNIDVPGAVVRIGEYGKYNALAGFNRNTKIVEYSDAVLAITNGSNGTEDSIKKAKELNKLLYVHSLNNKSPNNTVYKF